jgi:hypothetical protein
MWADTAPAILAYRRHRQDSFKRWDLRGTGTPAVANNGPIDATLDEMYVPLSFYSEESDRSSALTPEEIAQRPDSAVILGTAGSGKTTWMRWTFRRLIERATLAVIPFFLELRTIARLWKNTPLDEQTILNCLVHELKMCNVPDCGRVAMTLLERDTEPTPVLLVDGWDELGELGHRFRERLTEFRTAHPRAKVVVTSRPYGSSRPMYSDGFDIFEIQPLGEDDIDGLALRFHTFVHGENGKTARESADAFMQALRLAPDAYDLAETALLLTMMLILAREGPLPDRRHRLYDKCLRNLLAAHPDLGAREGVELEHRQWRPVDSEERIRVVAALAHSMQASGYHGERAQLSITWHQAMALLPNAWGWDAKDGFLAWLVGRAGVLVDKVDRENEIDDKAEVVFVSFAHLSFQEHLAAFHLSISADGPLERVALLTPIVGRVGWWETLRLWAGLIHDRQPAHLCAVLDHFLEDSHSLWLRGAILADGNGGPGNFDAWAARLATARDLSADLALACAEAWAASKQVARRAALAAIVLRSSASVEWMQRARIRRWSRLAVLTSTPATPMSAEPTRSAALCELKAMFGVSTWFPEGEAALLRLWPSRRISIGATLQTCATLGASRAHLALIVRALSKRTSLDAEMYSTYADSLGGSFEMDNAGEAAADFCREAGREVIRCLGLSHVQRKLDKRMVAALLEELFVYLAPSLEQPNYITDELTESFVCDLVDDSLIRLDNVPFGEFHTLLLGATDGPDEDLFRKCVRAEMAALGARCAARVAVAYASLEAVYATPTFRLFQQACRVSLRPVDRRQRAKLLVEFKKSHDPVWLALARRVSRTANSADMSLLATVARGEKTWDDPNAAYLGPIVRGDISVGGEVVSLETVCGWAGIVPPPVLEPFSLDEEDEESSDSAPSSWA